MSPRSPYELPLATTPKKAASTRRDSSHLSNWPNTSLDISTYTPPVAPKERPKTPATPHKTPSRQKVRANIQYLNKDSLDTIDNPHYLASLSGKDSLFNPEKIKFSVILPKITTAATSTDNATTAASTNQELLKIEFTKSELDLMLLSDGTVAHKGVINKVNPLLFKSDKISRITETFNPQYLLDQFLSETSETNLGVQDITSVVRIKRLASEDYANNLLYNKLLAISQSLKGISCPQSVKLFILGNAKNFIIAAFQKIAADLGKKPYLSITDIQSTIESFGLEYSQKLDKYVKYLDLVWKKQKAELSRSETLPFALTQPSVRPFVSRVLKGDNKESIENEVFAEWQVVALEDLEDKLLKDKSNLASIVLNAPTGYGKSWLINKIRDIYGDQINIIGQYDLNSSDAEITSLKSLLSPSVKSPARSRSSSPSPSNDRKKLIIFDEYFFQGPEFLKLIGHTTGVPDFFQLEELKEQFKKNLIRQGYLVIDSCATETPELLEIKYKRELSKAIEGYKTLIAQEEAAIINEAAIVSANISFESLDLANTNLLEKLKRLEAKALLKLETAERMKQDRKLAQDNIFQQEVKVLKDNPRSDYEAILRSEKGNAEEEKILYIIPDKDVTQFSEADFSKICGAAADNCLVITPYFDEEHNLKYKIFYKNQNGLQQRILDDFSERAIAKAKLPKKSKIIAVFGKTNSVGGDYGPFSRDITKMVIQTTIANGSTEPNKPLSEYKASTDLVQWFGRARSRATNFTIELRSNKTKEECLEAIRQNDIIQDNARITGYLAGKADKAEKTKSYGKAKKLPEELNKKKDEHDVEVNLRIYNKKLKEAESLRQKELDEIAQKQEMNAQVDAKKMQILLLQQENAEKQRETEKRGREAQKLQQMQEQYKAALETLAAQENHLQQSLTDAAAKDKALTKTINQLQQQITQTESEVEKNAEYYKKQLAENEERATQELEQQKKALEKRLASLQESSNAATAELKQHYATAAQKKEQALQEIQQTLEAEQKRLLQEIEAEQKRLLQEIEAEKKRLLQEQKKAQAAHEEAKLAQEQALQEMQQNLQAQREAAQQELDQLQERLAQDLQAVERDSATKKQRLLLQNETAIQALQNQADEAREALQAEIHKAKIQAFLNDALPKLDAILNQDLREILTQIQTDLNANAQNQPSQEEASSADGRGNTGGFIKSVFDAIAQAEGLRAELSRIQDNISNEDTNAAIYTDGAITQKQQGVNNLYDNFLKQLGQLKDVVSSIALNNSRELGDIKTRLEGSVQQLQNYYQGIRLKNQELGNRLQSLEQETATIQADINQLLRENEQKALQAKQLEELKQRLEQQQKQARERLAQEANQIYQLANRVVGDVERRMQSMPEGDQNGATAAQLGQLSQGAEQIRALLNRVADLEGRLKTAEQDKQNYLRDLANRKGVEVDQLSGENLSEEESQQIQSKNDRINQITQDLNDATQDLSAATTQTTTNLQDAVQSRLSDDVRLGNATIDAATLEAIINTIEQQQKPASSDTAAQTDLNTTTVEAQTDLNTTTVEAQTDRIENQDNENTIAALQQQLADQEEQHQRQIQAEQQRFDDWQKLYHVNTQQTEKLIELQENTAQAYQALLQKYEALSQANLALQNQLEEQHDHGSEDSQSDADSLETHYYETTHYDDEDDEHENQQDPQSQSFLRDNLKTQPTQTDLEWSILAASAIQFGPNEGEFQKIDREYLDQTKTDSQPDAKSTHYFLNHGKQNSTLKSFKKAYEKIDSIDGFGQDFAKKLYNDFSAAEISALIAVCKSIQIADDFGGHDNFQANLEKHLKSATSSYQELKDMNIAQSMQNYENPDPAFMQTVSNAANFIRQINQAALQNALQAASVDIAQSRSELATTSLAGYLKPTWAKKLQSSQQVDHDGHGQGQPQQ